MSIQTALELEHWLMWSSMQGFIVFDYTKQYAEARKELSQWLSEGKIQRKETVIRGGLAKAEGALIELYNGVNTGELRLPRTPSR